MNDERTVAAITVTALARVVSTIAAAALRLGFLVRGGATVGKLYHARGVVFGEALVEAVQLEQRTAIYPRIVLSSAVTEHFGHQLVNVIIEDDGIACVDYLKSMIFFAAPPGDTWEKDVKNWFEEAVAVIQKSLDKYAREGRLNELAKWTWFAKRFRGAADALSTLGLKPLGVSVDSIPWGA